MNSEDDIPPSAFYTGAGKIFVHRFCEDDEEPRVANYFSEYIEDVSRFANSIYIHRFAHSNVILVERRGVMRQRIRMA